jgi:hypothetical protein
MTDTLHGFPYWLLEFKKDGLPVDSGAIDRFINEVAARNISDLYIFSHGWNNDRAMALSLYDRFFGEVRKIVDHKNVAATIGVAGVIWPSILWPDDAKSAAMNTEAPGGEGGVVSIGNGPPVPVATATPNEVKAALKQGYDAPDQRRLIDELTAMLEKQEPSDDALRTFKEKLGQLLASEGPGATLDPEHPDDAEGAVGTLPHKEWRHLLETMGDRAATGADGGAVGLGDAFSKLWAGAKDVLRVGTYWQMKQRAGVIGKTGLGGRVLIRLHQSSPATRVHLIGHSFGARLVSFSLSGLPSALTGSGSPVKSLLLLQGAFSHFAFADQLPHDTTRSGALRGMAARVDGPLLATHSLRDHAVGTAYPAASVVNGDDAAAAQDQATRWGAMGSKGAQSVSAASRALAEPGQQYPFEKGKWMNLDGNDVIIHGGLPSGAHSDIVHPHTAWVALAAARVV